MDDFYWPSEKACQAALARFAKKNARRGRGAESKIYVPDGKPSRFILTEEIKTWEDLEAWGRSDSAKIQRLAPPNRYGEYKEGRYQPPSEPLKAVSRAHHHTTRGRSKKERLIDRYWFVHVKDATAYKDLAHNKRIPPRKTVIYPAFIPKGRLGKERIARPCLVCGEEFVPLRRDAKTCSVACRKRRSRVNTEGK